MKLTPKQEMFITEYMKDLNATQAAIRAGYSEKTASVIGQENLMKPYLRSEIDKRLEERAINNGITAEFVLNGIKDIAIKGDKESDKLKAFELLGKHLKLFTEKVESDNTNRNIEITLEGDLEEWAK
jgi:phage terminase small subunit